MGNLQFKLTQGDDHPSLEVQLLAPPADPESPAGTYDSPPLLDSAFLIYRIGSTPYRRQMTITDVAQRIVKYDWTSADKALLVGPATYKAWVRAQWSDGSKLTFPNEDGQYISLVVAADPEA
jgi:hypothetical protein